MLWTNRAVCRCTTPACNKKPCKWMPSCRTTKGRKINEEKNCLGTQGSVAATSGHWQKRLTLPCQARGLGTPQTIIGSLSCLPWLHLYARAGLALLLPGQHFHANGVYSLKWRLTDRYLRWGTLAGPGRRRSVQLSDFLQELRISGFPHFWVSPTCFPAK